MNPFTVSTAIQTLRFSALADLFPELVFSDLGGFSEPGPFVYVLIDPTSSGIIYIGKSDAQAIDAGRRAMQYPRWAAELSTVIASTGHADPSVDPANADLDLAWWSPIVRLVTRHGLLVKVASVAVTGESGAVWEARLKALSAILTCNESIVGGSGWEMKEGQVRGDGYAWAIRRLAAIRARRADAPEGGADRTCSWCGGQGHDRRSCSVPMDARECSLCGFHGHDRRSHPATV